MIKWVIVHSNMFKLKWVWDSLVVDHMHAIFQNILGLNLDDFPKHWLLNHWNLFEKLTFIDSIHAETLAHLPPQCFPALENIAIRLTENVCFCPSDFFAMHDKISSIVFDCPSSSTLPSLFTWLNSLPHPDLIIHCYIGEQVLNCKWSGYTVKNDDKPKIWFEGFDANATKSFISWSRFAKKSRGQATHSIAMSVDNAR